MAKNRKNNRFMPLSTYASPSTSRKSSLTSLDLDLDEWLGLQSPSPSPSDAFDASKASETSSTPRPYRSIVSRLATYPDSWTYKDLPPRLLATSGLCYSAERGEDACICHECGTHYAIQILESNKFYSLDTLLSLHTEDCLLADTIHDLISFPSDIYKPSTPDSQPTETAKSPPSSAPASVNSVQGRHPPKQATTTPPLSPMTKSTPSPPSSPRPASPARPSYAAVAPLPPPTSSSMTWKNRRPSISTPLAHKSTMSSPIATLTTPKTATTPQRLHPKQTPSPVLSVHDLECRFHNKPAPIYHQQNEQSPQKTPTTAIAQLLHAIADLLGSHDSSHVFNMRNRYHRN